MTDRELMSIAKKASMNAYVPYSRFPVGAALECDDGTVFSGCNVENAALGSTICAERTACCKAVSEGHRSFRRIAIYADSDELSVHALRRMPSVSGGVFAGYGGARAPRRATGTSAISSASCCRTGLIIDGAGAAACVRRRRG